MLLYKRHRAFIKHEHGQRPIRAALQKTSNHFGHVLSYVFVSWFLLSSRLDTPQWPEVTGFCPVGDAASEVEGRCIVFVVTFDELHVLHLLTHPQVHFRGGHTLVRGVLLHDAAEVQELFQLAFALASDLRALWLGPAELDQVVGLLLLHVSQRGERDAGDLGCVTFSGRLLALHYVLQFEGFCHLLHVVSFWRRRVALKCARAPKMPHRLEWIDRVTFVAHQLSDRLS